MVFGDDVDAALLAAAALANSADDPDTLTTLDELATFYREHGYTGSFAGDATELAAVRAVRPAIRELLTSSRDRAVELVNATFAAHPVQPRLVRHDELDYHVHAVPPEAPLDERIVVETAFAMIDVIRADELSRLSICADETCDGIVVDLSRNRSRRFCSTACGNRVAVAAYRARQQHPPE